MEYSTSSLVKAFFCLFLLVGFQMVTMPATATRFTEAAGETVEIKKGSSLSCKVEADCANVGRFLKCIDGHIHCYNGRCQCINDH